MSEGKKSFKKNCHLKLIRLETPEDDAPVNHKSVQEIKEEVDGLRANSFFESCPQKYEYMPCEACPHGKDGSCEWGINSEKDNYCFWNFVKRRSDPEGNMLPMLQSEIADLFDCSPTKIHFIIKEAMQKLHDNGYLEYLSLLSEHIPDPDERGESDKK